MWLEESDINKGTKENPKMDLDKLLEEVGQCGKFQLKIIAQCLIAVVFVGFNVNEFVFTAAKIETRCLIPECESTDHTEFAPEWITNAIPVVGGSLDNCQRYGNVSFSGAANGTCPVVLYNTSVLQACEQYVYENTDSVVYDFGLACDEWRRAIIGSVRVLGMMVALLLTGLVSDRWGRSRALALNTSCAAVLGLLRYWASDYTTYVLLIFFESMLGLGTFSSAYILTVEPLGPKYRVVGGAMINTFCTTGAIMLALIAWAVKRWKTLTLCLYIPQFISVIFFWTLTESVRWLMSKGKFKESEALLKEAARVNGNELSQKSLEEIRIYAENYQKKDDTPVIYLVVKHKVLMVRCLVTCTWWVSSTFVFYGLSINAVNLLGNMYLSYAAVAAVEIPGFWCAVPLINRFGRKPIVITAFFLCATCQLAFIYVSNGVLSVIVYFVGKWCIALIMTTINIFTLELYPTECRHRFYGFSSMVGRVGSIVSPLTPALGVTFIPELPFIMFGGMALLAGLVTCFVPETLGSKLADTVEEAFPADTGYKKENTKY